MDIVTIDLETYYDKEYSLSKMTTEAYVRDPRFEIICLGVKVNDEEVDTYSGDNPGRFLKSLNYSKRAILCHNTAFDGAILSWHFGIRPALWLDTLSMARPTHKLTVGGSLKKLAAHYNIGVKGTEVVNALGKRRADFTKAEMKRYMDYCANDVELTYTLFHLLKKGFPASELRVIDQTIRMYTEPRVVLDREQLVSHLTNIQTKKEKLLSVIGGDKAKSHLMSNPKFAALLRKMGVEPPMKTSPTTGKETYAFAKTDKGLTDLLEHPDPRVAAVVAARLGTKSTIEETRTEALIEAQSRGPLPIMLNYYGAHTGRFSGGDGLNLQNLPARTNKGIRRALCAPEGEVLLACDLSQIEARLLAWMAGQDDLVQAFREGRDVYSEFATDVFGYPVDKSKYKERFVGKTAILSLGYGSGASKFRDMLRLGGVEVSESEAKHIVDLYRQKNQGIRNLWNRMGWAINSMITGDTNVIKCISVQDGGITLPNKLKLTYPHLRALTQGFGYLSEPRQVAAFERGEIIPDDKWTRLYGGKLVENVVQALARIVITTHMTKLRQYNVVFQVHDEIVMSVPEDEAERIKAEVEQIMSTPPKWCADLPVACESGYAKNYGDVER